MISVKWAIVAAISSMITASALALGALIILVNAITDDAVVAAIGDDDELNNDVPDDEPEDVGLDILTPREYNEIVQRYA